MNILPLRRAIETELAGQNALREAVALYENDHWFSYRNFAATADHVAKRLDEIGLHHVHVDPIPANDNDCYSGWTTCQAWDVETARLTLREPVSSELADWAKVPHHLIMRSGPARGVYPVVRWQPGDGRDMRGRVAFTHLRPAEVQHRLREAGGLGLISDFLPELPGVRTRDEAGDHVLWEQVCFRPNPGGMWGFMLSPDQGRRLDALLDAGPVTVDVEIDARLYDGVTHAIEAYLPADEPAADDLLLIAHLYEPGANDNASGAGLAIEVLRTIRTLQRAGTVRLRRGIRALFAYEGRGTMAWVHRHPDTCRRLIAGLNIDEIGVDPAIGRSQTHLFMPPFSNPSFVGELLIHLTEQLVADRYRWKPVADRADIILDTRLSDPNIGVPTPCMIQYPAWTYHTSKDTPEVLSPEVLHRWGTVAAAYLLQLAVLDAADSVWLDDMLSAAAHTALASGGHSDRGQPADAAPPPVCRPGLLKQRLEHKQRELLRYGPTALPRLQSIIDTLPDPTPASGPYAVCVPHRTTLGSPGGTHVADLMEPAERSAFRANLLDHGLDLVFHHFFYWADGHRSLEQICRLIEDELAHGSGSDAIPRTTTGKLTHAWDRTIDRAAAWTIYRRLEAAGLMRLESSGIADRLAIAEA